MKKINKVLIELRKDKDQFLVLSVLFFLDYCLKLLLPTNLNLNQASGAMIAVAAGGALLTVGTSMYNGAKNRKAANSAAKEAELEKAKQMALLNEEKEAYKAFEFKNPYANVKNQFLGMENTMEDLTVNQQQAQFQAQQGAQSRSNIMQTMQGAAGGSGIASLAQAMANQGQLATQQASASIGQQESMNQAASAQQAASIQLQERVGEQSAEALRLGGEESVQQKEFDRQSTLLGMQAQMAGGAAADATSADQMALQTDIAARNQTQAALTGLGSAAMGAGIGGMPGK